MYHSTLFLYQGIGSCTEKEIPILRNQYSCTNAKLLYFPTQYKSCKRNQRNASRWARLTSRIPVLYRVQTASSAAVSSPSDTDHVVTTDNYSP